MAQDIRQTIFIEASLTRIQGDLRKLEGNFRTSFGNINRVASTALGALGIGIGVGGLIAFGRSVVQTVGQLHDLAEQTDISARTLSGLRIPLQDAGVSLESFSKGLLQAQRRLGDVQGTGKETAEALKAIGLSAQEMASVSTDEFARRVAEALAQIPNQAERVAIAARIFGRAGAEMANALARIAPEWEKFVSQGIDPRVARAMDELGTAIDRAKNSLIEAAAVGIYEGLNRLKVVVEDLSAAWNALGASGAGETLNFIGRRLADTFDLLHKALLDNLNTMLRIARVAAQLSRFTTLGLVQIDTSGLDKSISELDQRSKLIADRLRLGRERVNAAISGADVGGAAGLVPRSAPVQGLLDKTKQSTDRAKSDLDNFFAGLQRQIDTINQQTLELKLDPSQALAADLDRQLENFKQSLSARQLPIPKGLEEFFTVLKGRIVEASAELRKLKAELELADLDVQLGLDAIDTSTAEGEIKRRTAEITIEWIKTTKKIEELGRDAGLSQEQIAARVAEAWKGAAQEIAQVQAEALNRLEPMFRDLQRSLAIEILPDSERATARVLQEFDDRVRAIQEWRDAAIAAGRDVQQVNEEAAQATADAWSVASEQMKDKADETGEFMRRAMERGFDAVADGLKGLMDDGIANFEDFAEKFRKIINSLVADFLTLQLKQALLGEEFGKPGGAIGGLLGGLLGPQAEAPGRLPGLTTADVQDQEFGDMLKMLQGDGTVAIEATAATAQAGLTATQTATTTAIQVLGTRATTGIQSTGATAQAAIQAVQATAIAAIQAAAAAGGGGGGGIIGALAGGGGGAPTSPIGGAFDIDALMWHGGGPVGKRSAFDVRGSTTLKAGEVPMIGEDGEFMFSKLAVENIGADRLDQFHKLARRGALPRFHGGGLVAKPFDLSALSRIRNVGRGEKSFAPTVAGALRQRSDGNINVNFNVHGASDADSFRKSRANIMADLARAVERGRRHT